MKIEVSDDTIKLDFVPEPMYGIEAEKAKKYQMDDSIADIVKTMERAVQQYSEKKSIRDAQVIGYALYDCCRQLGLEPSIVVQMDTKRKFMTLADPRTKKSATYEMPWDVA